MTDRETNRMGSLSANVTQQTDRHADDHNTALQYVEGAV